MNILVCVKQVSDLEGRFVPNEAATWFDEGGHAWRMNEYDACAVEEAVRLKDSLGAQAQVTAISIGPTRVVETIRKALSMGCDLGVHIDDLAASGRDPWQIASMIAGYAAGRGFDLVFTGMQSEDRSSAQVGVLVAEKLGIACVTGITAFAWRDGDMTVVRELERGRRCTIGLKSPALLTCQTGLNTPRYPTLPNIMKARRAAVTVLAPEAVGVDASKVLPEAFRPHKHNTGGLVLEGEAEELADRVIGLLETKTFVFGRGGAR